MTVIDKQDVFSAEFQKAREIDFLQATADHFVANSINIRPWLRVN